jgi:CheY-like chemotaxis protein/HPt (histidine-containing phosphotransfer) domain-containing protein
VLSLSKDAEDPFHAAIVDMRMPGMDGADLGRVVKGDEKLKDIVLVIMTSLDLRGDAARMKENGFAACLTKPVRQSDLFNSLSSVLSVKDVSQPEQPIVTRHSIREMGLATIRVLLAEDNITNQEVAVGMLKKFGIRPNVVMNGSEAIKSLETIPYDLVLMDVQMPEMDGFEATRHIRNPRSAVLDHQVPIIALTAHAMKNDKEKCLKAGMNDYISKPISPQAFAETLGRWLPQMTHACNGQSTEEVAKSAFATEWKPDVTVFDLEGLMVRLMGDEELAIKVVEAFMKDIPQQVEALRDSIEAHDAESALFQAHTIKGASANVGGQALHTVALELEKAARSGHWESITRRMCELETQLGRLRKAMNEFINHKQHERKHSS